MMSLGHEAAHMVHGGFAFIKQQIQAVIARTRQLAMHQSLQASWSSLLSGDSVASAAAGAAHTMMLQSLLPLYSSC